MPTAFVAGATGYTGREVVRLLAQRGLRTVAHIRPESPRGNALIDRFQAIDAVVDHTPWQVEAMTEAMRSLHPDLVFCLIGITRASARHEARSAGNTATYESVDFGLTDLLVRATVAAGIRPRFVYLSAMGTGPGAKTAYGRARHRAEEAVRASGLPHTIARPGLISGPGRDDSRPGERLADAVLGPITRLASRIGATGFARRMAPIDNTTLANALVDAALDPAFEGRLMESGDLRR